MKLLQCKSLRPGAQNMMRILRNAIVPIKKAVRTIAINQSPVKLPKPLPHPLLHLLKLLLLKKLKQENKNYCYVNSFKQFRVVGIAFFIRGSVAGVTLSNDTCNRHGL